MEGVEQIEDSFSPQLSWGGQRADFSFSASGQQCASKAIRSASIGGSSGLYLCD